MFASDFQIIKFYIAQSKRFLFMICFGRISTSKKNRFRLSIPMARQMRWIGKWLRDQIDCVSSNHLSILNDYVFIVVTHTGNRRTKYLCSECHYVEPDKWSEDRKSHERRVFYCVDEGKKTSRRCIATRLTHILSTSLTQNHFVRNQSSTTKIKSAFFFLFFSVQLLSTQRKTLHAS